MPYRNKTGKCRKQLHVLAEVGRTKAGACKACNSAREKGRHLTRDYSGRVWKRPEKPAAEPVEWTPSAEPYVPGHALSISEKLRTGRCTCGLRLTGTKIQMKLDHRLHLETQSGELHT